MTCSTASASASMTRLCHFVRAPHQISSSLTTSRRFIRAIVPPRPAVTTIAQLDAYGGLIRDGTETDLSFIRTRDDKFYLQRILPTGELVRWAAPGLDHLRGVTNFDAYSLGNIDINGGVVVPRDVFPTSPTDPINYVDAIFLIQQLKPLKKLTRKDRRLWHRRLFAHWRESPEKFDNHVLGTYCMSIMLVLWLSMRAFYSIKNHRPFWDINVYGKTDEDVDRRGLTARIKRFSDLHPEHDKADFGVALKSPGQAYLSSARAELRDSDFNDPHYHSEFIWKVRHMFYYGHWPKGLAE